MGRDRAGCEDDSGDKDHSDGFWVLALFLGPGLVLSNDCPRLSHVLRALDLN